jgi:hypothetical protein
VQYIDLACKGGDVECGAIQWEVQKLQTCLTTLTASLAVQGHCVGF